jgi:hypothetical protein
VKPCGAAIGGRGEATDQQQRQHEPGRTGRHALPFSGARLPQQAPTAAGSDGTSCVLAWGQLSGLNEPEVACHSSRTRRH